MNVKKNLKGSILMVAAAAMLALPLAAHSQEAETGGVETVQPESGSSSTGPWENSAGSTIGTRENNSNAATPEKPDPRLGPGGGTLGRGPVTTAGGPGGNPDVPFDSNMNLALLAAGVLFAAAVVRKQLKVKAIPVQK